MKLSNIKGVVTSFGKKLGRRISEKSPELLMVAGTIGIVGSMVLVGKATIKAQAIKEEHDKLMNDINNATETVDGEPYTEEIRKKDTYICHVKTAGKFARVYGPAVAATSVSIACFILSHNIQAERIAGLTTAYNALNEAFMLYRKRNIADQGEDKDFEYRFGAKKSQVDWWKDDGKGNEEHGTEEVFHTEAELEKDELVFSRDTSAECRGDDVLDVSFLAGKENLLDYYLTRDGFLLKSDVVKELGIKRTLAQKLEDGRIGIVGRDKKFRLNWRIVDIPDYKHKGCFKTVYVLDPNFDGIVKAI